MEKTYLSSINLKENGECKDTIFSLERKYNPCVFPWRARYHTCSFCKREFKSAQALGGHMNVHRRERARLRELQSSWFLDSSSSSNPKLSFPSSPSSPSVNFSARSMRNKDFMISSTESDLIISHHQEKKPAVMDSTLHDFLEPRHQKLASGTTVVGVHDRKYCASDEVELLKKDNPFVTLNFIASLHQDSQEVLDLELRLGYP